ncbi:MAG: GlxA family transcriptional regulator [Rhizobiaceae bacterium]|nr:GlxA family transcriptional regulator [Rhizobiaceae bacterium]
MTHSHFSFVLIPGFSLVAFSCAIDALRGANLILDQAYYDWASLSPDGRPVISSSDIEVPTVAVKKSRNSDLIAICGGVSSHTYHDPELTGWLHEQASQKKRIGAISDGSYVAAEAGLFDQAPSTIHWRCQDAYRERFPHLDIRASMLEISDKRFSCAGGTASLDLMLHFIQEEHGGELVSLIAQNFFHDTVRDGTREQHLMSAFRVAGKNPVLSEAILLMERHLEQRLTIGQVAERVNISRRQLDRIFQQSVGKSPQAFYRDLRLTRASVLLAQTNMSVGEIALGCGFQTASHLGQHFKERFGATPGVYRKSIGSTL